MTFHSIFSLLRIRRRNDPAKTPYATPTLLKDLVSSLTTLLSWGFMTTSSIMDTLSILNFAFAEPPTTLKCTTRIKHI